MTRPTSVLLALVLVGGCAYDRIDPPPNESMSGPELSHPRECRVTGDPPPPLREELHETKTQLITQAEPAPATSSTLIDTHAHEPPARPTVIEPGVVTPLR